MQVFLLINRFWRLLMTALCFFFFGLGGLMLSTLWFNLLLLVQRDPVRRRALARASIAACFRFFLKASRFVRVLDYRFINLESLQNDESCLIVANHPTLIDYVLLASELPNCDCIVKKALLKNPFFSGVVKSADYLINAESETMIDICGQRLERGDSILIFPEGTRSIPNRPITLQRGAANIAVRCRRDIRIVKIHCSQPILAKHSRWYHIPPRKPFFTVEIKDRIRAEDFVPDIDTPPTLSARRLTNHLTAVLT